MSGLTTMLIIWGALTSVLVGLIIYRSLLTVHEEDQLFLSQGESGMAREQEEVLKRINRVNPLILWIGIACGVLLLVIGGVWIYHGLFTVPVVE